jgi:universal stress protein family protein
MNSSHSLAPVPVLRIVHTTDFSAASQIAFVHALKLALVAGAQLDLLHVSPKGRKPDWIEFPGIHQTLLRWGVLPNRSPSAAPRGSGLRIGKIVAIDRDPVRGALDYLRGHATELLVLATHQRRGIDRWLHKAAAEPLARESGTLTLFLPRRATGFVSHDTGGG